MAERKRNTKYEQAEDGTWGYIVTHKDGHQASGFGFEKKDDARDAAKSVDFEPKVDEDS